MSRPKVLVTNANIPKVGIEILQKRCDVILNYDLTKEGVLSNIKGVDAIFFRHPVYLDNELIEAAGPQLKVVAAMASGLNLIDVVELKKRDILVSNTVGPSSNAVANIAVGLALAASRRFHEGRLEIEKDHWMYDCTWMGGQDLFRSNVGIIGLGAIGQTIIKRLKGFEISNYFYSGRREKPEGSELGAKFVPLDTLLAHSDFVFISCPLTEETRSMCNDSFFSKMKKTAVLINVARGAIVDQPALVRALRSGTIFAAGLDVTTPEPLPRDHDLLTLPNVVITPHAGVKLQSCWDEMAIKTSENLLQGLIEKGLLPENNKQ